MNTLIHSKGDSACGNIAFLHKGERKGPVLHSNTEFPDGSKPNHGDPIKCFSCGYHFKSPIWEVTVAA